MKRTLHQLGDLVVAGVNLAGRPELHDQAVRTATPTEAANVQRAGAGVAVGGDEVPGLQKSQGFTAAARGIGIYTAPKSKGAPSVTIDLSTGKHVLGGPSGPRPPLTDGHELPAISVSPLDERATGDNR